MIRRKWNQANAKLEKAFFPVGLCDLKYVLSPREGSSGEGVVDIAIPKHKAVVALDNKHVFATVTDKYRLVTNKQAYDWAKPVINAVFQHSQFSDFQCFNVKMTSTRSKCYIDLVRKSIDENPMRFTPFRKDDPWVAFIRITNSYNRTSCLKYQLGFCRWICQNGVIFGDKSVDFVFTHTCNTIDDIGIYEQLNEVAKKRIGEIQSIEESFIAKLNALHEIHVASELMFPMLCKVFNRKMDERQIQELTKNQREMAEMFVSKAQELIKEYTYEFGQNAYAMMNILTDFASFPVGYSRFCDRSILQARVGNWMNDFVKRRSMSGFNLEAYIGVEAIKSATCFKLLEKVG